jgi:Kef-type K+ transport system membrane component KefB
MFHTYFNLHRVSLSVIFMEDLAIMILFPVLILLWSRSSVSILGLNVQLIFWWNEYVFAHFLVLIVYYGTNLIVKESD